MRVVFSPLVIALAVPTLFGMRSPTEVARQTVTAVPVAIERTLKSSDEWVVDPTENEARYRVRERLAMLRLPYDAIGRTNEITGTIEITPDGRVQLSRSEIRVNVENLTSDKSRRDDFVRLSLLESQNYPEVVFVPTEIAGLTMIPTSGRETFNIRGNLTVKDVTRPTDWEVTADFSKQRIRGTASTTFTFADFMLEKPAVAFVLSLADEIKLEYDFTLVRKPHAR